jgi:translocation and assembly module TamA
MRQTAGSRINAFGIPRAKRPAIVGILVLCFVLAAAMDCAQAADAQAYRVALASTGDDDIDSTLKSASELISLGSSATVSPFGLIARARRDGDRLKSVLESYGYYTSRVDITIDGAPLRDLDLADRLQALPKEREAQVAIAFELGPLYHLRDIRIDGAVPADVRDVLGLHPGDPAVASQVVAAGARVLSALQERGYAFARVDPPVADEDAKLPLLDVTFNVASGAQVRIGTIGFAGLVRVREATARRRLKLRTGARFRPDDIERARRDLLDLGVFASVNVQVGPDADPQGAVPVTFTVRERPRHAVNLTAAYSTDLGGSSGASWTDRNLFGRADQLIVAGSVTNIDGKATTGIGYDTSVKYILPDFGRPDQSLQVSAGANHQALQAYDQRARTGAVTLTRRLTSRWTASAGVSAADEQIIQDGVTHDYTLVGLPLGLTYDSTDLASPLDDPRHGIRAAASVTPTVSIGKPNATFMISQIKAAAYLDMHDLLAALPAGRSVLAARGLVGLAQGAGEFSLPPDQRFYAGGSGTIRGYNYQSVGPLFANTTDPVGGTAVLAGGLEFRQRFGRSYGAAVYVDGGQVSSSLQYLPNVFRIGVGAGLRYYTPIGPIRFDVAVPTQRIPGSNSLQIYIGLGQAF